MDGREFSIWWAGVGILGRIEQPSKMNLPTFVTRNNLPSILPISLHRECDPEERSSTSGGRLIPTSPLPEVGVSREVQ